MVVLINVRAEKLTLYLSELCFCNQRGKDELICARAPVLSYMPGNGARPWGRLRTQRCY
jgi:hypothetical protein